MLVLYAQGAGMPNDDRCRAEQFGPDEPCLRPQVYELISRLRHEAESTAERRLIAAVIGVEDLQISSTLQVLAFTPHTAALIFVLPMVHACWADGRINRRQRGLVLDAARRMGVEIPGPGERLLSAWLDRRPSDAFFELSLRILGNILRSMPSETRESREREISEDCLRVRQATRKPIMITIRDKAGVCARYLEPLMRRICEKWTHRAHSGQT